jgi:hypothetical protein
VILAGIRNVSRFGLANAPKGFFRRLGAKINILLIFPTKPAPLRRRIQRLPSNAISMDSGQMAAITSKSFGRC